MEQFSKAKHCVVSSNYTAVICQVVFPLNIEFSFLTLACTTLTLDVATTPGPDTAVSGSLLF